MTRISTAPGGSHPDGELSEEVDDPLDSVLLECELLDPELDSDSHVEDVLRDETDDGLMDDSELTVFELPLDNELPDEELSDSELSLELEAEDVELIGSSTKLAGVYAISTLTLKCPKEELLEDWLDEDD